MFTNTLRRLIWSLFYLPTRIYVILSNRLRMVNVYSIDWLPLTTHTTHIRVYMWSAPGRTTQSVEKNMASFTFSFVTLVELNQKNYDSEYDFQAKKMFYWLIYCRVIHFDSSPHSKVPFAARVKVNRSCFGMCFLNSRMRHNESTPWCCYLLVFR